MTGKSKSELKKMDLALKLHWAEIKEIKKRLAAVETEVESERK